MTAVTRTTLRQRFARLMRAYRDGTATSGSTINLLECTTYPYRTTAPDTDYADWWLYRPAASASGDVTRRVGPGRYDPEAGRFFPDAPWTVAPYVSSGEAFELHGYGLNPDEVHDAINQALKQVLVPDRFLLMPTGDDTDVNSFSRLELPLDVDDWLTNPSWVRQVGVLSEGPLRTATVSASLNTTDLTLSAARSSGALATFYRDRTRGGIKRVQMATLSFAGSGSTVTHGWDQPTTEGNLLVMIVVAGAAITTPTGWTLAATGTNSTLRTAIFYKEAAASESNAADVSLGSAVRAVMVLLEYQGIRPSDSLDQTASSGSGGYTTGTTTAVAEGDELYVAALGSFATSPLSAPTERFEILTHVMSPETLHTTGVAVTVLERSNPHTDLQERWRSFAQRRGEARLEAGRIVFDFDDGSLTAPAFAVVDALRPAYTFCRLNSTGDFGTKLDGLTAEANQVDVIDELVVVAGATVWAYQQFPRFREWADADESRIALLAEARRTWQGYLQHRLPRLTRTFRPLHDWGM